MVIGDNEDKISFEVPPPHNSKCHKGESPVSTLRQRKGRASTSVTWQRHVTTVMSSRDTTMWQCNAGPDQDKIRAKQKTEGISSSAVIRFLSQRWGIQSPIQRASCGSQNKTKATYLPRQLSQVEWPWLLTFRPVPAGDWLGGRKSWPLGITRQTCPLHVCSSYSAARSKK